MTSRAQLLKERLARDEPIDLRGCGRLMLAVQSLAAAVAQMPGLAMHRRVEGRRGAHGREAEVAAPQGYADRNVERLQRIAQLL
jgi:hypothetical protein